MTLPLIVVLGATATGKSDLALELAERHDGEIINADALQLYRGMDIGTAKLATAERRGIPHHLIDVLEPSEEASVAAFQAQARSLIDGIRAIGRNPILVGGSGLYLRAVVDDIRFPGTDPQVRARLEARAAGRGLADLHAELAARDPLAAERIAEGDERRVVRALEVMELTGERFSAQMPQRRFVMPTIQIGLHRERSALGERIARRTELMWEQGLLDEAVALRDRGWGRTAASAIGYSQAIDHHEGRLSAEAAREGITLRTRQFAKRQGTWFRRDPRITWLEADVPNLVEAAGAVLAAGASLES